MLPLSADKIPTTAAELAEALRRGLQNRGIVPRRIETRGDLPAMEALSVDLTEAHLTRDLQPPGALEGPGAMIEIAAFEVAGTPIYFEKAPLEVRLAAQRSKSRLHLSEGRGWLALESAAAGTVSAQITREALESLLHALAREAAAQHGVEVRKTILSFTQLGPRAVAFRAEVTAKVFIMSATLALTGRLEIDDELNARLSELKLDGDGMLLNLAGGFARPHLERLEGRVIPLSALAPSGLKLREVELITGPTLEARARFGSA